MQTATLERTKIRTADNPYSQVIDLGNGVQIPVESKTEAQFVADMINLAKQGKATLPKNNAVQPIPDNTDIPEGLDWRQDYEYARSDRF